MDSRLEQQIATLKIRYIRIGWCDNAGLLRAKAVHVGALAPNLAHGIGITPAQQALPVMGDTVVAKSGLGPVGEVRLVPDWTTLTALPYAPGHARVLGDMVLAGQPWSSCPRHFLRRMVADAALDGIEIQAAFENEFYLLRPGDDGPIPADDTVFAATWSMDQHHALIDDLTAALLAQGLEVEAWYPESGPGQQELSIRHATGLAAADQQVVFRETTRAIALRHGLRASFLPKPFDEAAGSGAHVHLSLWREGVNLTPDALGEGGLSPTARAFVAGILDHLPALVAVTTPTPNSFRRLKPRCWAGAFRIWGVDNREAAVRVLSRPDGPGALHWEVKPVDATCNPYLALGAIIACGLDGLRSDRELPAMIDFDPGELSDEEARSQGIEALPGNLGEALVRLRKDTLIQQAMGEELFRSFVAVREAEQDALGGLDLEDEVRLLWQRY